MTTLREKLDFIDDPKAVAVLKDFEQIQKSLSEGIESFEIAMAIFNSNRYPVDHVLKHIMGISLRNAIICLCNILEKHGNHRMSLERVCKRHAESNDFAALKMFSQKILALYNDETSNLARMRNDLAKVREKFVHLLGMPENSLSKNQMAFAFSYTEILVANLINSVILLFQQDKQINYNVTHDFFKTEASEFLSRFQENP